MTRALLHQALDAMQEIYFYILSSNNNLPYKKLQEGIEALTAALAQPEPEPVAWMDKHGSTISSITKTWSASKAAEEHNIPLYAAPPAPDESDLAFHAARLRRACTLTGVEGVPEDDATLIGSLGTVLGLFCQRIVSQTPPAPPDTYRNPADDAALKKAFDAMESGIVAELRKERADMTAQRDRLMWGHAQVCEKADTDRLDAQRWRFVLAAMDANSQECAELIAQIDSCGVDVEFTQSLFADVIDAAIATGGQP